MANVALAWRPEHLHIALPVPDFRVANLPKAEPWLMMDDLSTLSLSLIFSMNYSPPQSHQFGMYIHECSKYIYSKLLHIIYTWGWRYGSHGTNMDYGMYSSTPGMTWLVGWIHGWLDAGYCTMSCDLMLFNWDWLHPFTQYVTTFS